VFRGGEMGSPLSRVLGSWFLFSSAQWMFMVASGVAAYRHDGAGAVGVVAVAWSTASTGRVWWPGVVPWRPWRSGPVPWWCRRTSAWAGSWR
jgi:hypothetical protein